MTIDKIPKICYIVFTVMMNGRTLNPKNNQQPTLIKGDRHGQWFPDPDVP